MLFFILFIIIINYLNLNVFCTNLLKYPNEIENQKQLLVENWKQNVVYLVKYPKITSLPDLSINCFKIEIWLKLKNIQFYIINNQFKIGSPKEGIVPFIQFNDKFIEGSENIINELKHFGKPLLENNKEEKIIKIIENIFYPILIKDRMTRDEYGNGGLDFLAYDKSLQEQLLPKIKISKNNELKLLNNKNKNITYIFENNLEFWTELFNLEKGIKNIEKDENDIIIFLNKYIKIIKNEESSSSSKKEEDKLLLNLDDWAIFIETKNKWIESILKEYFYKGEHLLDFKSNQQQILLNNETINYIINKFDYYLTQITQMFFNNNNNFLFGDEPTNADIYLFAVLIQFFEGPLLNIPQLEQFFQIEGYLNNNNNINYYLNQNDKKEINEIEEIIEEDNNNNNNNEIKNKKIKYIDNRINILYKFVEEMKKKLEENELINLRKYPIKLNYEPNNDFLNKKYNGPFNIETNELFGINKLLDYERIFDLWSLIIDYIRIKYYGTITLNCLASYLCNLGREFNLEQGNDCKEYFLKKVEKQKKIIWKDIELLTVKSLKDRDEKFNLLNKTANYQCYIAAKIANNVINEFNEQKINLNIKQKINKK